jgi:N-acetylglucosaminyl-diphospho-decaprenol L-rhamnosyltransferase
MNVSDAVVTVIVVSFNTRELTLAALRTLFDTTRQTPIHVVVFDNDSQDGSAAAVADAFPQVELIRSGENLGFARANNVVAAVARTEWLLLLNPDTECHPGAVDNLMRFARETPRAGIWGGRTVFPDGALNIASCWNRITLWSVFCRASGLSALLPSSELFNPEAMGGWQRDTVRQVDIVVGCFLLIRKELWDRLGGFDLKYFMYGEEADLCLRVAALGYRPMITPEAQIMHIVGAASSQSSRKKILVHKARVTLMRDHWPAWQVPLGRALMWLGAGLRAAAEMLRGRQGLTHREIWRARRDWMSGY